MRRASRKLAWALSLIALAAFAAKTSNQATDIRRGHQAVLLRDGTVLVVGGNYLDGGHGLTLERFVPWQGWETVGKDPTDGGVSALRAVMLNDGRVLMVGEGARVWNPLTGQLDTNVAPLTTHARREQHTLTVLRDGNVLVAGGVDYADGGPGAAATPVQGQVNPAGDLSWVDLIPTTASQRKGHTATLLADGRVALVGGQVPNGTANVSGFGLFAPGDSSVSMATGAAFSSTRTFHTTTRRLRGELAVHGNALSANGGVVYLSFDGGFAASSQFATYSLASGHAAVLAPNGDTFILGGFADTGATTSLRDIYRQAAGAFLPVASVQNMLVARAEHTATVLMDGKVLVVGGNSSGPAWELFEPVGFGFQSSPDASVPRGACTGTALPSGEVLLVGGERLTLTQALAVVDQRNVPSDVVSPIPLRTGHTATLVTSDEVLILGGLGRPAAVLSDCWLVDVYDAGVKGCAPMPRGRSQHTATLLADGRVLVTGGRAAVGAEERTEAMIFDPGPDGGRWSMLAQGLGSPRANHAAVLLPNGRVLFSGGAGGGGDSLELFTPALDGGGSFGFVGTLTRDRVRHTMTLLRDGRVLITGGTDLGNVNPTAAIELFSPDGGGSSPVSSAALGDPAASHGAVALPTGDVVIAGGAGSSGSNKASRFSPLDDSIVVAPLAFSRKQPVVLLDDQARAWVLDGADNSAQLESYSTLGAPQPLPHGLQALIPVVDPAGGDWSFLLQGRWREASEASTGGVQSSPVNVPRLLFQRYDNGQVFAPRGYRYDVDSERLIGKTPNLPQGHYRAWAYVSGMPGTAAWFRVGSRDTSIGSSDGGSADGGSGDGGSGDGGSGDGGVLADGGAARFALTLSLSADPDPRLVGLPVTATVVVDAPPQTAAGRLAVKFSATEGLQLCAQGVCPAAASTDWPVPSIDGSGQASHQLAVRPVEARVDHALTATLELDGVAVDTKTVPLGAEAPELRPELCGGCSSGAPALAALAALAWLARRRRPRR